MEEPTARATREEIAERLKEASPSAGPYLAENLLAAVRFATRRVPEAAIDVGDSKLGCSPDLPSGTAWPSWTPPEGDRRPLQFFAQVDLARATAVAPGPLGLPAEGLLSFFADFEMSGQGFGDQPGGSIVVLSPTEVPFARHSPRLTPLPSAELQPIGVWTWPASTDGGNGGELPERERAALDALRASLQAELQAEVPELWHGSALHQLGGHSQLATGEGRPPGEWRTLLQLDSDPTLEITWANGGRVCWAARQADVDAGEWAASAFTFHPR